MWVGEGLHVIQGERLYFNNGHKKKIQKPSWRTNWNGAEQVFWCSKCQPLSTPVLWKDSLTLQWQYSGSLHGPPEPSSSLGWCGTYTSLFPCQSPSETSPCLSHLLDWLQGLPLGEAEGGVFSDCFPFLSFLTCIAVTCVTCLQLQLNSM